MYTTRTPKIIKEESEFLLYNTILYISYMNYMKILEYS